MWSSPWRAALAATNSEPAWRRRARRQLADARVLLRLGAGAELPVTVIVDPLTGIGSYTMRLTGIAMPENHTVTMIVRDANGVEQARQIFDFAAFIQ